MQVISRSAPSVGRAKRKDGSRKLTSVKVSAARRNGALAKVRLSRAPNRDRGYVCRRQHQGREMMRALYLLSVAAALIPLATADAANRMTPAEIQAGFFNGQPFTASTPSNIKFNMVFKSDG